MIPTRRNLQFKLGPDSARNWHERGAVLTHFVNAMSLTFPEGERYFIHTVRHFREQIRSPELQQALTAFIGQEALHGREHEAYNRRLEEAGLPAGELQAAAARFFEILRTRLSPAAQLSITIAQEHFTAIISELLLTDPDLIAGADERVAALWRWHALEEIEHKAVAFDVYEAAVGRDLPAYLLRAIAMVGTTAGFLTLVSYCQWHLLKADRRPQGRRGWRRFAATMAGRRGLLGRMARPWLDYFRPDFHPWQHDNRSLLDQIGAVLHVVENAPATPVHEAPSTRRKLAAAA